MGENIAWPPERFQILALDGGGVRGLYTATMLAALEKSLQTSIVEHFDLIAGTSTGGIIALGLALGKTPEELASFYRNDGPNIFPQPTGFRASIRRFCGAKHKAEELERCLVREFGDKRLADCSRAVVLPTYNLDRDAPVVLKTPHHADFLEDLQIEAWKAALATSAAPTYLPASAEIRECRHVDGGVWANNPAVVGAIEAYRFLNIPLAAIHVLSIGTGKVVSGRPDSLSRGGLWAWRSHGTDVLLRAQSESTQNQLRLLLRDDRVIRVNPSVPPTWRDLDVLRREFAGHGAEDAKTHTAAIRDNFMNHCGLDLHELRAASCAEDIHV